MSRRRKPPWIKQNIDEFIPLVCTGKGDHRKYYFGEHFKLTDQGVERWVSETPRLRQDENRVLARRMTFPVSETDPFTGEPKANGIVANCGKCDRSFQRKQTNFHDEARALLSTGVTLLDISWMDR